MCFGNDNYGVRWLCWVVRLLGVEDTWMFVVQCGCVEMYVCVDGLVCWKLEDDGWKVIDTNLK